MSDASPGRGAETLGVFVLCGFLVAVGVLAWRVQMVPALEADATRLGTFPTSIGPWRALEIPMDDAVEAELRADLNIQRAYRLATGEFVWLYIGYYGTARGGRPEHTPRNCYVSADWGIESASVRTLAGDGSLRVNEYEIERYGERRLVQFWYRSHRRTGMTGGLDQNLDRLLGRLLEGRGDGGTRPRQRADRARGSRGNEPTVGQLRARGRSTLGRSVA